MIPDGFPGFKFFSFSQILWDEDSSTVWLLSAWMCKWGKGFVMLMYCNSSAQAINTDMNNFSHYNYINLSLESSWL